MKEMMRYGFILALICTVASAALAGVNALTKSKIASQAREGEDGSLKEVMPEAVDFEPVTIEGNTIYYKALNKEGKLIGVAFKAGQKGYSSDIEVMAGMTKEGVIKQIKVLSQNETPGLGARITESSFTGQFSGRNIQDLSQVQAITGATISSKAVIDAVTKKAQSIKELISNEK